HLHNLLRMKDIEVPVGNRIERAFVKSSYLNCENKKVQVYFLSNDRFFAREGIYSNPTTKEYFSDNDERFIFYCRGVLETLKRLGWQPKVIHCNDWQCGLIPMYLKTVYKNDPYFKDIKTVFTAYSLASHGIFPKSSFEKTGLPAESLAEINGHGGKLNFLDAGMHFADISTTFGVKADKKLVSGSEDSHEGSIKTKKSVISLTVPSQNGKRGEELAEKFVSIYRDLAKS
ncbi:MAG TPA: glycogen/starch synthase, partial [Bacteroidota bacterium]|nr:glycogen/starch synthase [Bacteroidota bacterium]